MKIIGIETAGLGTNNQMRGIVIAGAGERRKKMKVPISREALLKDSDGTILHPKNYAGEEEFREAIKRSVGTYLLENEVPDFVVLPIDHARAKEENKDIDLLSKVIKETFADYGHNVKTMALASNLYDYRYVDLIHVGKHLLTDEDESALKANPHLQKKVVKTLGVPSNINWKSIRNLAHQPVKEAILAKYKSFKTILSGNLLYGQDAVLQEKNGKKNALFSLGGITDNGDIGFDLHDARKLMKSALRLKSKGYNVIFTNSPRTPSDVTDYLYEKCQVFHMDFFNSKNIANNEEEAKNFRNYNGKYKTEFKIQAENIGNIYPAILGVCEFVVNTHDSFSYTSDAAVLGLPSVVYTGNFIDSQKRYDCYKLFDLCHKEGYVISLEEAIEKIDRGEVLKTKKMDDVSTQLVRAMMKTSGKIRENVGIITRGKEL